MILGATSIDPRRVTFADIEHVAGSVYKLKVERILGDAVMDTDILFTDLEDAEAALVKLDKASYKTELADAISDKSIDQDDDEDEQGKLGFL